MPGSYVTYQMERVERDCFHLYMLFLNKEVWVELLEPVEAVQQQLHRLRSDILHWKPQVYHKAQKHFQCENESVEEWIGVLPFAIFQSDDCMINSIW